MDIFKKHIFTFGNEGEANAFADGIEFVNDSSLEIENIEYDSPNCWVVSIIDYDKGNDDDDDE
jgi:hypothetical protein